MVRGWPWSMQRFKKGSSNTCLVLFDKDLKMWNKLRAMDDKGPVLLQLERRHQFQRVSVKPLEMAIADPEYGTAVWQQEFQDMLHSHAVVACPSQIVEDCVAAIKTAKAPKAPTESER